MKYLDIDGLVVFWNLIWDKIKGVLNGDDSKAQPGQVWTANENGAGWETPQAGGGGGISDVTVNGKSVVSGGVASIPIGNASAPGTFMVNSSNGVYALSNGHLSVYSALESNITGRNSQTRPIVPKNLDLAVKAAMTDGKGAAWSDEQKTAGRERMGIVTISQEEYDLIDDKGDTIYIIEDGDGLPQNKPVGYDQLVDNVNNIISSVNDLTSKMDEVYDDYTRASGVIG